MNMIHNTAITPPLLATLTILALTSGLAHATHYPAGNVTFNGSVAGTTCQIDIDGSDISTTGHNATVAFLSPPVDAGSFGGQGQGPDQDFILNVTNCNVSNINLMFSGTPDANNSSAFANSTAPGSATGVAVALRETLTSYPLLPGQNSTSSFSLDTQPNHVTFIRLTAKLLQTTAATPTAGNVTVNTVMSIIY